MEDSNLEERLKDAKQKSEEIHQQQTDLQRFIDRCEVDVYDAKRQLSKIESSRYAFELQEISEYYYNQIRSNAFDFQSVSTKYEAELNKEKESIGREIEELQYEIKMEKENKNEDVEQSN